MPPAPAAPSRPRTISAAPAPQRRSRRQTAEQTGDVAAGVPTERRQHCASRSARSRYACEPGLGSGFAAASLSDTQFTAVDEAIAVLANGFARRGCVALRRVAGATLDALCRTSSVIAMPPDLLEKRRNQRAARAASASKYDVVPRTSRQAGVPRVEADCRRCGDGQASSGLRSPPARAALTVPVSAADDRSDTPDVRARSLIRLRRSLRGHAVRCVMVAQKTDRLSATRSDAGGQRTWAGRASIPTTPSARGRDGGLSSTATIRHVGKAKAEAAELPFGRRLTCKRRCRSTPSRCVLLGTVAHGPDCGADARTANPGTCGYLMVDPAKIDR